jgi:RNA polymerase-binding protein DksA
VKATPAKASPTKVAEPPKKAAVKAPATKVSEPKGETPKAQTPTVETPKVAVAPAKAPAAKRPAVREDESPWTPKELAEVKTELELEIARLSSQIAEAEEGIADLLRDSGDGAGDDQADAGTKTFEREHEMSLANNARDLLFQNEQALAKLGDGTYGSCERCGNPIGKLRLQAFPRATLCVSCKQLEERR